MFYFFILFLFLIDFNSSKKNFLSLSEKESYPVQNEKRYKLVLIRHGQISFNQENLFTPWNDVELTKIGIEEAITAGEILKNYSYNFDICFTSTLKRSIKTSFIILDKLDQLYIPIIKDFHLNERHYGAIQGLNKKETSLKYGKDLVYKWRSCMSRMWSEI